MDQQGQPDYQQNRLRLAKDLYEAMEQGRTDDADIILLNMTGLRESYLFQELGKLTRELHEAVKNFMLDERVASLAEEDIPDARLRLKHVIDMTDQSATRTLNAVETALPMCDTLLNSSQTLDGDWKRFVRKEMAHEEFRRFSKDLGAFFENNGENIRTVQNSLKDILMAQDFQDLTGQIIKRVINLVDEVEKNLVNLIRLAGTKHGMSVHKKPDVDNELDGPQVPGLESNTAVKGQDEVDDLLASFGF